MDSASSSRCNLSMALNILSVLRPCAGACDFETAIHRLIPSTSPERAAYLRPSHSMGAFNRHFIQSRRHANSRWRLRISSVR
ncbi:hypothetical protein FKP32DRAFT_1587696 [Trametes sanguinea]|nr:hypothetical protein FKP32DRAFT_1587696 [Trametes sanguinea]